MPEEEIFESRAKAGGRGTPVIMNPQGRRVKTSETKMRGKRVKLEERVGPDH